MLKFDPVPKLKPNPTPRDHDSNKLESKVPENAFTKVTAFLVNWFTENTRIFSIHFYV